MSTDIERLLAIVEKQAAQIERLVADRQTKTESEMTLRELWDRYVLTLPAELWVRSTKSTMIRLMNRLGDKRASTVRPADWADYRDDPSIRGHYSVTTRNIQLKRLRAMLNWAVSEGRLEVNYLRNVKLERTRPKRETEITEADEERLFELASPFFRAFYLMGVDSALRFSEIRNLRWDAVDFASGTIALSWTGAKSKRSSTAYLTARSKAALEAIRDRVAGSPFVFANPKTGRPYSQATIWYEWRDLRNAAGLKAAPGDGTVHFHDSRHTICSRLVRKGATLPAVQGLMRHTNLTTTALYINMNERLIAGAHALLSGSLARPAVPGGGQGAQP